MQADFRHLILIVVLCCCASIVLPAPAAVDPTRLLLLRGALALADGDAGDAVGDLRSVAGIRGEDWQAQLLYGQALLAANEPALARGALDRATLLAPWRPEVWAALAAAGRATQDATLETAALAERQRRWPDDPTTWLRLRDLARTQGDTATARALDGRFQATLPPLRFDVDPAYRDLATPTLRRAAHEPQATAESALALAAAEWRAGDGYATHAALRLACARKPDDAVLAANYAHLCFRIGQVQDGIATLAALAARGVTEHDRALARWACASGDYASALSAWDRLHVVHPADPAVMYAYGATAVLAGKPELAVPALRQAWGLAPDAVTAQQYATALYLAGHGVEAADLLRQAQRQYPADTLLSVLLTLVYRDTQRLNRAADLTAELAAVRAERVSLLILAGERFARLHQTKRTLAFARTLRDDYPGDLTAVHGAVQLFRLAGAPGEAQFALTRLLGPNLPVPQPWQATLRDIARDALDHQDLPTAQAALENILARDPEYRPAYELLGKVLAQQGQWGKAVTLYAQALETWRMDGPFLLAQARAAVQLGNVPLAVRAYRRSALGVKSPAPWLELGDLYHTQGDEVTARVCWRTAAEYPDAYLSALRRLEESYTSAGAATLAEEITRTVREAREAHRRKRTAQLHTALAGLGLAPTDEEIDALVQLEMMPEAVPAP